MLGHHFRNAWRQQCSMHRPRILSRKAEAVGAAGCSINARRSPSEPDNILDGVLGSLDSIDNGLYWIVCTLDPDARLYCPCAIRGRRPRRGRRPCEARLGKIVHTQKKKKEKKIILSSLSLSERALHDPQPAAAAAGIDVYTRTDRVNATRGYTVTYIRVQQ